jgi:UDP-N-acetylmuramoylalanine--D-glutamate ligase
VRPAGRAVLNAANAWTAAMSVPEGVARVMFGTEECQLVVRDGVIRRHDTGVSPLTLGSASGSERSRRAVDDSAAAGRTPAALETGVERYVVRARPLRGAHNLENAMAAIEAARALGASPEAIQRGLDSYPGLPHRIESVRTLDGVEWVNDSKATNVDSVEKSLAAFPGPLHLIAGGLGKGAPYAPLRPLLPGRVVRLYVIGEDAARLEGELGDLVPVERCGDLVTAAERARAHARPGETVLLSPACASFDQFRSFEHRGRVFCEAVRAWGEGR